MRISADAKKRIDLTIKKSLNYVQSKSHRKLNGKKIKYHQTKELYKQISRFQEVEN